MARFAELALSRIARSSLTLSKAQTMTDNELLSLPLIGRKTLKLIRNNPLTASQTLGVDHTLMQVELLQLSNASQGAQSYGLQVLANLMRRFGGDID